MTTTQWMGAALAMSALLLNNTGTLACCPQDGINVNGVKPLLVTQQFDGSFLVTDEYIYTHLDACRMTYKVLTCEIPMADASETSRVVAEGEVRLPAIAPGETGTARFDMPDNFWEGDVLELEAFDKRGSSVRTWSYPIRLVKPYLEHKIAGVPMTLQALPPATVTRTDTAIVLQSRHLTITFDAATGMLASVKAGTNEIPFNNGPVAVGMKMRYNPAESYVRHTYSEAIYCAKYQGGADSIVWRLTDRGLLYMDALLLNRAEGGGGCGDALMDTEVCHPGLTFSYPEENCTGVTWMGRGACRLCGNRLAGTGYGVWQKDYHNTITGDSFGNLACPECKGCHADMYWATLESDTTPFTVYARNDGIFYRVFTPEEPAGCVRNSMPAFPEGGLSFLLDMPAIDSYKPVKQQEPDSRPGKICTKEGGEGLHLNLLFDFRESIR